MSALAAAASDEDGDTIKQLRAALQQARDWIAERPDRRPISAGYMVGILTNALAAAPQPPVVEQQSDSDMVSVPRSLLGAACAGMRHRLQDAPKVLEQLRRYTVGDLSKSAVEHPQGEQEPDWTNSETGLLECWKNPLHPMPDRLRMADGAVAFRDKTIANLRLQLAAYQSAQQLPTANGIGGEA